MPSRFAKLLLFVFACSSAIPSFAQQIIGDVVISGLTLKDDYMGPPTCDADGQLYRRPASGRGTSIMKVARDGSTTIFGLAQESEPVDLFAPSPTGVVFLNSSYTAVEGITHHLYRFDSHGNLLTRQTVAVDFQPWIMAVTSSGKTIVVGFLPRTASDEKGKTYSGAVLDANGQVLKTFDFPPTTQGTKWAPSGHRMQGSDGVAYLILESRTESSNVRSSESSPSDEPTYSIATITDSGQVNLLLLAAVTGVPYRDWMFGKDVAVEHYQLSGHKGVTQFDAFDLASRKKISSKTLRPAGFALACYLGEAVSMLAHSANIDKSRSLSPDTLRLVTIKLE
jgi:hypothetical protein